VAVLAISLWVHVRAGLTFPVPWSDEPVFVYPAEAVADAGQIQTDSLHAGRPVFYHPPGYPVALGLFLKFLPPGLGSARLVSWIWMALAYLFWLGLVRNLESRRIAWILVSIFFLGTHTTIAGNIARPEALVLVLALAGFFFLVNQRPWTAAALTGLACLVHPSAWILAGAAGLAYLREHGFRLVPPRRGEYAWIVLGLACALAMTIYLGWHWKWVWHDLQVGIQFLHQTWGQRLARLAAIRNLIPALVFLSLPVVTWRRPQPLFTLSILGVGLWFIPVYRPEMWYLVYTNGAYLVAGVVLVEMAARRAAPAGRRLAAPAVAGLVLVGSFYQGHVPDPRHYPDYFWWCHMTIRARPAYIEAGDYDAIGAALAARAPASRPARVQFHPIGDGALFLGRLPAPWIPYRPAFTDVPPDAIVFHQTRLAYPGVNEAVARDMAAAGADPSAPVRVRDETETWYVHFPAPQP
jgi:hypothetical protein